MRDRATGRRRMMTRRRSTAAAVLLVAAVLLTAPAAALARGGGDAPLVVSGGLAPAILHAQTDGADWRDNASIARARRTATVLLTAGLALMAVDQRTDHRGVNWAAGGTLSAAAVAMGVELWLKRKPAGGRRQSLHVGTDSVQFNVSW